RGYDWFTTAIVEFESYEPRSARAIDVDNDGTLELVVGGTNGAEKEHDAWYAVEMLDRRVGFFHTETRSIHFAGRPAFRTLGELYTEVQRGGSGPSKTVVTVIRREWIEDDQGRTLRVEVVNGQEGADQARTTAEVVGEVLSIGTVRAGIERRWDLPWDQDVLSPRAIEGFFRELLASPRQTGTYRGFNPEVSHEISTHRARVVERFQDGGGIVEDEIVDQGVQAELVLDSDGRPVRHVVGPVVMHRVTRDQALEPLQKELGPYRRWIVTLDRPLPAARRLREAAFELVPRDQEATPPLRELFLEDRRQAIETD
ncbi:MAG: hypothetical protein GY856_49145, partial [bacterium]|nr:hypothetical protein [bacterium]